MDLVGVPDDVTPLAALVIVKALDEDGDVAYYCKATEGLSSVEALGMAGYADVKLRSVVDDDETLNLLIAGEV